MTEIDPANDPKPAAFRSGAPVPAQTSGKANAAGLAGGAGAAIGTLLTAGVVGLIGDLCGSGLP